MDIHFKECNLLHCLFNKIFADIRIPSDWITSNIMLLHTIEVKHKIENYRRTTHLIL